VKIPGIFKKPFRKKALENNYAKFIEHPQDKKFFLSCFEEREEKYYIRDSLSNDEIKKLKELSKVIKDNKKGAVYFIPLAFVSILVAAVIIFFTIFANPLLGMALEHGLEAIFEAKSNVYNFRLSLIRFQISIGGVTVANRDSPMTNLFQLGRTEIRFKPAAILRGKVYIEEIRADTIRFGTERAFSGSLPGKPPRDKTAKEKEEAPPLVNLQNFDVMALLNQEFDKLNTPRLYDEAINTYNETVDKWKGQVESTTERVNELRAAATPLLNINVSGMRDVEAIRSTIQDLNNARAAVQAATNDVTNIVSGIESDFNTARALEANARSSINDDINHIKSYVDLGSGSAFNALEPFIRDILSDAAEQYLDYGLMALELLESLRANAAVKPKEEKPKKEPRVAFKGVDVQFPTIAYPTFYLGTFASDFTIDSWNWAFDLQNVSSHPDFTQHNPGFANRPVVLTAGMTEVDDYHRQISVMGSADFRTNTQELFSANVTGSGFPVSLGDQLSNIGINGFEGNTAFNVSVNGENNRILGNADIRIAQPRIVNPSGIIAEAVDSAVRQTGTVNMGIDYIHQTGEKDIFKITTNISDLIGQTIRNTADAYLKKAMDEVEKALREKIDQYIDGRFVSKDELDGLMGVVRGDKGAMDQMSSMLNSKINEFEQRINSLVNETVQQVTEDVSRQAEQAARDALQGNTPSLQLPSLPGLPRR